MFSDTTANAVCPQSNKALEVNNDNNVFVKLAVRKHYKVANKQTRSGVEIKIVP